MLKKLVKSTIVGAGMLVFAGAAHAASNPIEINLNGATAQYNYWVGAAKAYLANRGCANVYSAADGKNGIEVCQGKQAFGNIPALPGGGTGLTINGSTNDTIVIRYTGTGSGDGVNAINGTGSQTQGTVTCTGHNRPMAQGTDITLASWATHTVGNKACEPVTIGASDVNATTFNQSTNGYNDGPELTGGWQTLSASGYSVDPSLYNDDQPLIVPFAFFAKSNVPYDNLSRLMAVQIFGGQLKNWNQLTGGTSHRMTVCLRHAGSGTLATLDAAIMRGDYALWPTQNPNQAGTDNTSKPKVYFNNGTPLEMNCIDGNSSGTGVVTDYAIGFADADQATKLVAPGDGTYQNTKLLTLDGVSAAQTNIINGLYDFWSAQNLYWPKSTNADKTVVIQDLMSYAGDSANLPAAQASYWVTAGQMKMTKDTDFTLPHR